MGAAYKKWGVVVREKHRNRGKFSFTHSFHTCFNFEEIGIFASGAESPPDVRHKSRAHTHAHVRAIRA